MSEKSISRQNSHNAPLPERKNMKCICQRNQQPRKVNKRKCCQQGTVGLVVKDTHRRWHRQRGNGDYIHQQSKTCYIIKYRYYRRPALLYKTIVAHRKCQQTREDIEILPLKTHLHRQ